jgi:hypothetical protein
MRITKVEELANCDIQRLTERFGKRQTLITDFA